MIDDGITASLRCVLEWVADELLDGRTEPEARAVVLRDRLMKHGVVDRRVARRAVAEHPRGVDRRSPPDVPGGIEALARAAFDLVDGLPALREGRLPRMLVQMLDPDALACFHPQLRLPTGERFDWPTVPPPAEVDPLQLMAKPTLDGHVHLGGILPPLYFWLALCGGELPLTTLSGLCEVGASRAMPAAWMRAVGAAAADRLALAWVLQARGRLFTEAPPISDARWRPFEERLWHPDRPPPLRRAVLELSWAQRRRARPEDGFVDPLREHGAHFAAGERCLLYGVAQALRRMGRGHASVERRREADRIRETLLRYLRVRNAFHQTLVIARGDSAGLSRFLEISRRRRFLVGQRHRQRRQRRLVAQFQRHRMATAVRAQLIEAFPQDRAGGPARSVEIRTHVPTGRLALRVLRSWLEGIADALGSGVGRPHRVGLIFHLGRSRDAAVARAAAALRLRVVHGLLAAYPSLRRVVVGLDVAGDERSLPPRVLAPPLVKSRRDIDGRRPRPDRASYRLGWTYHVGEDSWDLLTGLRHIDEVVSLILPPSGGRLGHALALADAPDEFYMRRGDFTEPSLAEHLLDLVWARGRLRSGDGGCFGPVIRMLEQRLERYAPLDRVDRCWYHMALDRPLDADESLLDEDELLEHLGVAQDADLRSRRRKALVVLDPWWSALVGHTQATLQARIARRPITIEANPTSNLTVGGFGDYDRLPYQALVKAKLPVSLNTDDPGLFSTTLAHEYAHLYRALTADGTLTHREVMDWLRGRLRDGIESRFIRDDTPDGAALAADLAKQRPSILLYDP